MTKTLGIASFCIVFLCLEPFGRSADCKVAAAPVSDSPLRSAMENALLGHTLSVRELDALEAGKAERERWRPYPVRPGAAQWIWLPSARTLPNTFVLFRREVDLAARPTRAKAWLTADSRYLLTVNGHRVQWGPAPCDPRSLDVDPADLTALFRPGKNVIGVEVLHYGIGDGTWPAGKPGLLFHALVEMEGGRRETVVSDPSWLALVDRAHRPGAPKRWYLRALQEEFDARLHPCGWDTPGFKTDASWMPAMVISQAADKPAAASNYPGGDSMDGVPAARSSLRLRQIPPLRESEVPALRLADSGRVEWLRDPLDWFEFRMPNTHRIVREPVARAAASSWKLPATPSPRQGVYATFEFEEQIVGWPRFTIDAPKGTVVEVMTQESHDPNGPPWLDTHFFSWTRFICREGVNQFENFDYESLRWLQLHVRNAS